MKAFVKIMMLLCVAGATAGGGYWFYQNSQGEKSAKITRKKVKRGDIALVVSTTGRVIANFDVEIKCKASGQVAKLPYDVSDFVKKGDLLIELNPLDEQRLVEQAKVELFSAKAKLNQAQQNLVIAKKRLEIREKLAQNSLKAAQADYREAQARIKRQQSLIENSLASQEQYDKAVTDSIQSRSKLEDANTRVEELAVETLALKLAERDIDLARAEVKSKELELSLAEQRLADTKVFSPLDGVVVTRNVQTGQIISSGISNVGGGTPILTISDLSKVFVLAFVDESDIGKVQVGNWSIITVEAFPQKKFYGKVVRIATRGIEIENVVTFEVKIEVLDDDKSLLKPEMTTSIKIVADSKKDALMVRGDAIYTKNIQVKSKDLGKNFPQLTSWQTYYFVQVSDSGRVEERQVEIGLDDGERTEITKGLREGEEVIIFANRHRSKWDKQESLVKAGKKLLGKKK